MTSGINQNFLAGINTLYPIAGQNNSSQGFRNNFSSIHTGFRIVGNELTNLGEKQIQIIGDATGVSRKIKLNKPLVGNSPEYVDLTLTLSASGVTAGTYTSNAQNITHFTVDSKGRITRLTQEVPPARTAAAGVHKLKTTETPEGTTKSLISPRITVDDFGTITEVVDADPINLGLVGLPLTEGAMLVGKGTTGAQPLPIPPIEAENQEDIWVVRWKPTIGNDGWRMGWEKLPKIHPFNPALVVNILGGDGITVDNGVDGRYPEVNVDPLKYALAQPSIDIGLDNYVLVTNPDPAIGTRRVSVQQILRRSTDRPLMYEFADDGAPKAAGNISLFNHKIYGDHTALAPSIYFVSQNGVFRNAVVLESRNAGRVTLRNVQNINTAAVSPNDPSSSPLLPEAQWRVYEQSFPQRPPAFTPELTNAGIDTAVLKSKSNGLMYWEADIPVQQGVTEIIPGNGLSVQSGSRITSTGTLALDFMKVNAQTPTPDLNGDQFVAVTVNGTHYRMGTNKFALTMRNAVFVDPEVGQDDNSSSSAGQANQPYKTIGFAISRMASLALGMRTIILLPGNYVEDFAINKANVIIRSFAGKDTVNLRGEVTINPHMGTISLSGLSFNIANTTPQRPRILNVQNGIHSLLVNDCAFYQEDNETLGAPQEIISMFGEQTGNVEFTNCKFNGKFVNGLVMDNDESFVDSRVRIINTIGEENFKLCLEVQSGTNTEVSGANLLWQLIHKGGWLDVKNVGSVLGYYTEQQFIASGSEEPMEDGYYPNGIISTAPYSSNMKNFLALTNVSFRRQFMNAFFAYSTINKTGDCDYSFGNVIRPSHVDVIMGNRFDNHSTAKTDVNDFVKKIDAAATQSVNARIAATWDLTLKGTTELVITGPYTSPTFYAEINQSITLRVLVRQDNTGGRALTWSVTDGTIIWDGGSAPVMPTDPNAVMFVEFQQVGTIWLARKLVSA